MHANGVDGWGSTRSHSARTLDSIKTDALLESEEDEPAQQLDRSTRVLPCTLARIVGDVGLCAPR